MGASACVSPERSKASRYLRITIAAAVLLSISCLGLGASASATTSQPAFGDVYTDQCVGLITRTAKPLWWRFDCHGHLAVTGTWTGGGTFHAVGRVNLLTGDATGTIDDVILVRTRLNKHGGLHLYGTVTVNGADGQTVVQSRILGGTNAFKSASGNVTTRVLSNITGGPTEGIYTGTWSH